MGLGNIAFYGPGFLLAGFVIYVVLPLGALGLITLVGWLILRDRKEALKKVQPVVKLIWGLAIVGSVGVSCCMQMSY